jgi:hypothetical protein
LPLHFAAQSNTSAAVVQAVIAAHPDAAKAKDKVRSHGYTACARRARIHPPPCYVFAHVCPSQTYVLRLLLFLRTRAHLKRAPFTVCTGRESAAPLGRSVQYIRGRRAGSAGCLSGRSKGGRPGAWPWLCPPPHAPHACTPHVAVARGTRATLTPHAPALHRAGICRSILPLSPIHQRR